MRVSWRAREERLERRSRALALARGYLRCRFALLGHRALGPDAQCRRVFASTSAGTAPARARVGRPRNLGGSNPMERTSEQRLARDRRLAMELLVEQTYRFPDKPPKNVAGLIDRASLLAFYRVHNAGLATEAKVEEILSGYRGRTHVLALMLAKKYGKKLVERLQSTPRSPASTARRGRALRPVNSSARQQRTKKKVRAAVVAEESVPFATSPDEERAAVASARLEARYAAERLHRERTRRAEEAVEVERARAEKHAEAAAGRTKTRGTTRGGPCHRARRCGTRQGDSVGRCRIWTRWRPL